ncbi:hypothetical protein [Nocardioides rubriscoriae]|uniref:hypothetical protein n=1 Tax=Nocardioides rubriscoriae TaxID=642762 RepID=UPI0011DF3092|nr:hypothetical protein [Nocardioides rubriscoriae]
MKALATVVLLLGLTACSGSGDDQASGAPAGPASTTPSSPSAPLAPPPQGPGGPDLADTEVCDLVRQGIDQFNLGDLDATIARFEDAVPLAEQLAEDQPSAKTETLLDAVRYYAGLPAEDYQEANVSSPEFAEFKDFTLTECAYTGLPAGQTTDPAIPA